MMSALWLFRAAPYLYVLQDRVLKLIFSLDNEFYLTGGTALHRFYYDARYSDDLDFFTNYSNRFFYATKNIISNLKKEFNVKIEIESKDFLRLMVNNILQVDFVNDRVPRYKEPKVLENGFIIDNIENILSNKITAVIGRDNPKDIFDIYLISKFYNINWQDIISSAKDKLEFSIDELIVRLVSFPQELFKNINLIDKNFLDDFEKEFPKIIEQIKKAS